MPLPRGRTLALGYNLEVLGGDLTYSIARFHTELVTALLRRGGWRRLVLIAAPYAPRRGRRRFEERPTVQQILRDKPRSVAVELTDYPSLAASPSRPPAVLHEGGWQDLIYPFRLRRFFARDRFPVTVSHHGLTPHGVFQSFGLDLLLCDSRSYDAILCTSRAAQSIIQKSMDHVREALACHHGASPRFRGRLEVIGPGVDPRVYRPRPKRPLRERFGLPPDALVLLWLGRFTFARKANLLPLLRVLRFVVDDSPGVDVTLVIAGNKGPPDQEELFRRYSAELGLADRIRRITSTPPEDDPLLHAAADVFVCPSDMMGENFGLAPVQAMACGVPQVVSDWDGHRDTVVHGETGFRVPTLWGPCDPTLSIRASFLMWGDSRPSLVETTAIDVRAFREHLGALVRSEGLRRSMGHRSRERACALFSLDHVASRYEALWGELSAEARASRTAPPPWVDTMRAPLQEVYRAQVTEVLDGHARLLLSEAGARVLQGAEAVPISGMEPSVIEHAVAWRILGAFTRPDHRRGRGAGAVVRAAARACRRRPDAVWCNVMWLLKYGYLEVERADGGRR
jgi:glycosyltransferase involved in cell wall biosynthesis